MPRHVPDDFSFLPTVDSTDDEIVEKQAMRKAGQAPADEPVQSMPEDEEPPEQDARALWEAFMLHDEPPPQVSEAPMPEPEILPAPAAKAASASAPVEQEGVRVPPRAPKVLKLRAERGTSGMVDTPPVSFGGSLQKEARKEDKAAKQESHGDAAEGQSIADSGADPNPKPFVAPKALPEAPLDPETAKKRRWQKLVEKVGIRSLGLSVGVHVCLLVTAAFVGLNQIKDRQVDFLPGGGSAQSQAAAAELTNKIQQKKNPWLKTKPQMQKITVQSLSSDIVLPEMPMDMLDMSSITSRMDISKVSGSLGLGGPAGAGTAG